MARVNRASGPGELAAALAGLEVRIDSVRVSRSAVPLPDYPDGPRPSSVLHVTGSGELGLGELVSFEEREHAAFAVRASAWFHAITSSPLRVGEHGFSGTPYERAAVEAALIDLALRQAGLALQDLTGVRERLLRFVASLSTSPDPRSSMSELRADGYTGDFKIDVDSAWDARVIDALAADRSVVILDFKRRTEVGFALQLCAHFPRALLEDPPDGFEAMCEPAERARISRDATLLDSEQVADACARGEAVNLKAPRMGGPLELLRGLELALRSEAAHAPRNRDSFLRAPAYIGGMFEVAIGRSQARQLAALFCAEAPNDLAPNAPRAEGGAREDPPVLVRFDQPGFGLRAHTL